MSESLAIIPVNLNQAHLFVIWQGLGGDSRVVARATGIRQCVIESLAHDFSWEQLAGGKLGLADRALEKEINRVQNYAQAIRLRKILDVAVDKIETEDGGERFKKLIFSTDQMGNPTMNTKPLVELAKAVETVHNITYRALGDKVAEQADAVTNDTKRVKDLGLTIYNLVNRAAQETQVLTPREILNAHRKIDNT